MTGKSKPNKYKNYFYTLQFEDGKKINRRFYRHEILKVDRDRLLRSISNISQANKQIKPDPNNPYDFFNRNMKVIDAQQFKTKKTKDNPHGFIWELSFKSVPYKQLVHPDRVYKANKHDQFYSMFDKETFQAEQLIGKRFKSYWKKPYNRWYKGTITDYNRQTKKHKLEFDTGIVEWDNLKTTNYRWKLIN